MELVDLIIIGGGPSGLNVAISAQRAGLRYLVLEKGVLANSIYHFPRNMTFFSTSKLLEVGNVPFISHSDKPTRSEALEYYRRLKEHWNIEVRCYEEVQSMVPYEQGYKIQSTRREYYTRFVVVATGFYDTPNWMHIPGESLPKVKHYYDDAHPYIDQQVLVVGARNSACDAALELYQKGAKVRMAVRGTEIHPNVKYWIRPNIVNRISEGSIPAYFQTKLLEIKEKEVILEGLDGIFSLPNDFVLAMTGYQPNYELLHRLGISCPTESELRIPEHDPDTLETNLPGVFLSGVICGGRKTNSYFIENTRDHGEVIIERIAPFCR